jgi:diadenosine tetraphosphate (Ap4A) HIT family hydrolase
MDASQKAECPFCERLLHGSSNAPWDTTLAETQTYKIVPTKGALVPGWLLVISKKHVLCAGALDADEFNDLEETINLGRQLVGSNFGPATVFEHGPQLPETSLGCGIDHLHFHIAPLRFSLVDAVDSVIPGAVWKALSGLRDLKALHRAGIGYAMIHEPGAGMLWFQPPSDIRQPLRRAIATQLGVPELFDYATHPHLANVLRTVDQFTAEA